MGYLYPGSVDTGSEVEQSAASTTVHGWHQAMLSKRGKIIISEGAELKKGNIADDKDNYKYLAISQEKWSIYKEYNRFWGVNFMTGIKSDPTHMHWQISDTPLYNNLAKGGERSHWYQDGSSSHSMVQDLETVDEVEGGRLGAS